MLTGRELRGSLMGHEVYTATDFDILPLSPSISVQQPPHPVEGHLLALVRSHLHGGSFLLSYGWDVTRRLQAQWEARDGDAGRAMWEVVCTSFTARRSFTHFFVVQGGRPVFLEQVGPFSRALRLRADKRPDSCSRDS